MAFLRKEHVQTFACSGKAIYPPLFLFIFLLEHPFLLWEKKIPNICKLSRILLGEQQLSQDKLNVCTWPN